MCRAVPGSCAATSRTSGLVTCRTPPRAWCTSPATSARLKASGCPARCCGAWARCSAPRTSLRRCRTAAISRNAATACSRSSFWAGSRDASSSAGARCRASPPATTWCRKRRCSTRTPRGGSTSSWGAPTSTPAGISAAPTLTSTRCRRTCATPRSWRRRRAPRRCAANHPAPWRPRSSPTPKTSSTSESNLVVALRALLRRRSGVLGRLLPRGSRCHHIDDDEVGQRPGGGIAELAVVSTRPHLLHRSAVAQVLRVHGPDRVLRIGCERVRNVADPGLHPLAVLLFLHHEADEFLGRLRILAVLEDHLVEEQVERGARAGRPHRVRGVVDVGDEGVDLRLLGILRGVVDRESVVAHRDLVVAETLVVARLDPGERSRHEGGIEFLRVLQRLDGLLAVDHHFAGLVYHLAAEIPDHPVAPGVGVAGGVAESKAARRALGLQRLHHLPHAVGVLRKALEPGRLHMALAVDHHAARGAEGDADPALAVRAQVGLAGGIPAAVFLPEVAAGVGDVDQLLGVEVRVVVGG